MIYKFVPLFCSTFQIKVEQGCKCSKIKGLSEISQQKMENACTTDYLNVAHENGLKSAFIGICATCTTKNRIL